MKRPFVKMGMLLGFVLVAAIGISTIATTHNVNASATAASNESSQNLAKAVITVEGMSCGGCVDTINAALSKFEGVADIKVDIANGKTEVIYQVDKITDVGEMADAITASGYSAKVVRIVTAEELRNEQLQAQAKSAKAIASVGNMEISRTDYEAELAHARGRYEMLYGNSVFSDQRGTQLLANLKVQITRRLITEAIQLHEINRASFDIGSAAFDHRYQEYLDKRGLTPEAFGAELEKNGYSTDYFMRKFRDRVLIESYVNERVFDGITNETEKQKRYTDWFNNARLLAEVTYYDKDLERQIQPSNSGAGGCGNSCSATR